MAIDLEAIKQSYSDIRPDGVRFGYYFNAEHAEQLANDIDNLILEVELLRTAIRVHDSGTIITCYSITDWQAHIAKAYQAELTKAPE